MSVEDRLFTLVNQCRQQQGDSFIQSPALLVPRLSSQAPDLHAEIKALAVALENNAAGRIANAANADAETDQIKKDIAVSEKLSLGVVEAALAVARRMDPLSPAAGTAASTDGGWAGDSVIVGAPATPQYQQPQSGQRIQPVYDQTPEEDEEDEDEKPPIWQNKWVIASAVIALAAVVFQSQQPQGPGPQPGPQPAPQPAPQPMPQPNPQPGPQPGPRPNPQPAPQPQPNNNPMPLLQPANGQLPLLQSQKMQDGSVAIGFSLTTQVGTSPAMIMLPAGGWDMGGAMFGFWRPGSNTNTSPPDSLGMGMLMLYNMNGAPVRATVPQWQQDNIGFGAICVAFQGQSGQDVQLSGSTMCIMDGNCQQASGCGRVQ